MRNTRSVHVIVMTLMAATLAEGESHKALRPVFQILAEGTFDTASIPPYPGDHAEIYAYIDAHLDAHVGHLQRWVRQRCADSWASSAGSTGSPGVTSWRAISTT